MSNETTRDRIVAEADRLFYERGYEHTSFADIADAVGISRGNFYYHFKSKDEILDAVIGARAASTRQMLETWEAQSDGPVGRIRSFIRIVVTNQARIMRHGCPVGTLCTELAKLAHPAQPQANRLFTLFRSWLRQQFVLLGRKADADALAMHVLAFSQGVAVLAHAFHDKRFVQQEVERMCAWLDGIAVEAAQTASG
ncbi:TetR/AcrR family transcriptional regulator [Phytopseudomonas dryadis]|uniref:TetR family transcriptional regulator n=1 Tax=Phytopseudomonas dryadis TaxID=2487520 RepID=A0ABY1Z7I9_9GAMM|nr:MULTISPECIES: TetR/AcrR family transcriptional regulator [Pseudomonas]TBV03484.1 TetR family transcriptional regulator [Pseudomonas dryadis]TBV16536.1 TetR family transcriptional regulator [Pseudomonas sp. FRB 230]